MYSVTKIGYLFKKPLLFDGKKCNSLHRQSQPLALVIAIGFIGYRSRLRLGVA